MRAAYFAIMILMFSSCNNTVLKLKAAQHSFIEIDNNKCILCSRCVRICKDVVGANALGLVNRGFETYVAPSMGTSLLDTTCESCGMCISTCPTAAIGKASACV